MEFNVYLPTATFLFKTINSFLSHTHILHLRTHKRLNPNENYYNYVFLFLFQPYFFVIQYTFHEIVTYLFTCGYRSFSLWSHGHSKIILAKVFFIYCSWLMWKKNVTIQKKYWKCKKMITNFKFWINEQNIEWLKVKLWNIVDIKWIIIDMIMFVPYLFIPFLFYTGTFKA